MTDETAITAAPGRVGRWRNRLAVRVFKLIATRSLYDKQRQNFVDAAYWRGHLRRRELGFVKCVEEDDIRA